MSDGWVGVDLDGTLAVYTKWLGYEHVGKPIKAMVDRVIFWLNEGVDVRILTARVSPMALKASNATLEQVQAPIRQFCLDNFGRELAITCEKDLNMLSLWDDRCVQVITNTGRAVV